MIKVIVSQREDKIDGRAETRDALDQNFSQFLLRINCLTFPVPNSMNKNQLSLWLSHIKPDAIVLSGGGDIGAFPKRDGLEDELLNEAESSILPVLGLCRGMQLMAHRNGSSLQTASGHVRTRHHLNINGGQWVNSYHDSCISHCPDGYHILAQAEDGEIEMIGHDHYPWEGWMWHPEREDPFNDNDIARLMSLFQEKGKRSKL